MILRSEDTGATAGLAVLVPATVTSDGRDGGTGGGLGADDTVAGGGDADAPNSPLIDDSLWVGASLSPSEFGAKSGVRGLAGLASAVGVEVADAAARTVWAVPGAAGSWPATARAIGMTV